MHRQTIDKCCDLPEWIFTRFFISLYFQILINAFPMQIVQNSFESLHRHPLLNVAAAKIRRRIPDITRTSTINMPRNNKTAKNTHRSSILVYFQSLSLLLSFGFAIVVYFYHLVVPLTTRHISIIGHLISYNSCVSPHVSPV